MLVALTIPGTDLVAALLLAQGGLLALGLILIDEVDNAYGDVYSGSVAGHSLRPNWSVRAWGMALAVLCTALALVLPMHSLEPFLLMLSSVFVPLYGAILARLARHPNVALLVTRRKVNTSAVLIWLLGIACYHLCAQLAPSWGAALPTLVLTFALWRASPVRAGHGLAQRPEPHGLRRVTMIKWAAARTGAHMGTRFQRRAHIGPCQLHSAQQ